MDTMPSNFDGYGGPQRLMRAQVTDATRYARAGLGRTEQDGQQHGQGLAVDVGPGRFGYTHLLIVERVVRRRHTARSFEKREAQPRLIVERVVVSQEKKKISCQ